MSALGRRSRTVSPFITHAVLDALERDRDRSRHPRKIRPESVSTLALDEHSHTAALTSLLARLGPTATIRAGRQLSRYGTHPVLEVLAESRDPRELLRRFERLEPVLHLGNRTRYALVSNGVDVTQLSTDHTRVELAESLFVCGAQIGMLQRIGCRGVTARLIDQLPIWPPPTLVADLGAMARRFQSRSTGRPTWSVRWRWAPSFPSFQPTGSTGADLRRMISEQPAHPWTISRAADELHVSSRTLQRRLHGEGARFAGIVNEARLDAAEALLVRTALPIGAIAHLCGFFDHSHLVATARRHRQQTPTDLRRTADLTTVVSRASGR